MDSNRFPIRAFDCRPKGKDKCEELRKQWLADFHSEWNRLFVKDAHGRKIYSTEL